MQKILAAAMLAGEPGMAESMVGIIMPGNRLDQVSDCGGGRGDLWYSRTPARREGEDRALCSLQTEDPGQGCDAYNYDTD